VKTWKTSPDPDYEAEKNRVLELYAIADGRRRPGVDDPSVVICCDEFGPLNLQPHPGKQWAPQGSVVVTSAVRGGVAGGPPTPDRTAGDT
jgi:hypothetical protein